MRAPDRLEARAREMAMEAGHDPDARIAKPGTEKTQPAWCAYRDAVRDEMAKTATDALAASLVQDERYAGAPLKIFGKHDEQTINQMRNCMKVGKVLGAVLCADGHLGYAQPVGGVIAYEDQISISGVGFDIACGNMAVRLDARADDIRDRLPVILADIRANVSFGVGRKNETPVAHDLFDDREAWLAGGVEDLRQKAMAQLGTVGSGNHYVDVFEDKAGFVWIGVHFGSRGLGHTTATRYLKAAGGQDGIHVPPAVVDEAGEIGTRYLAAMDLAGRYAYAGREWVVERVRQIIGGAVTHSVHNHHNFAWRETHGGKECWVVRKGATPAFPGQQGFVGGSMGDDAVIIEGVAGADPAGLASTIHGAGRLFGRKQAHRTFTREQMDNWLRERGVLLSGGDIDESPMAYRRLPDVLAEQGDTIRVLHTLRPMAVAMAGDGEFDPYKD